MIRISSDNVKPKKKSPVAVRSATGQTETSRAEISTKLSGVSTENLIDEIRIRMDALPRLVEYMADGSKAKRYGMLFMGKLFAHSYSGLVTIEDIIEMYEPETGETKNVVK